ncbi:MAG: 4-hydroxythreonine-4-phosphate dehydrogenase, partial [Alphaproteobacteria bacterium]|nr:4-hydroxythreonine-4-phosphate dehydrogenase [Alphaproteobacteria bacterium]
MALAPSPSAAAKPVLALAIGDPAGIGPELAAKLVADPAVTEAAHLIVIGDRRVLKRGADVAKVAIDLPVVANTGA